MRRLSNLPVLVVLMGIAALSMLLPWGHAVVSGSHALARSFLYSLLFLLFFVVLLGIATSRYRPRNAARSHLIALAGAYLLLPCVLALPMMQPGAGGHRFSDVWFEMLSAMTTTGAPMFAPWELPPTLHLWRAQVGWMGGFFTVVMAMSVLAPLNLGGAEVMTGRTPGRGAQGASQVIQVADPGVRMLRFALLVLPVYGGMTLLLWLGLILAGEDNLTALCHAMGTLSTSGLSPIGGLAEGRAGWLAEVLIFLFLIPALSRRPLLHAIGMQRDQKLARDPELRLALVILLCVSSVFLLRHWIAAAQAGHATDFLAALQAGWGGLFMTMSFLTTTGFESAYWRAAEDWSGLGRAGLALWGLAVMGGGIATTAGGVKLLRMHVLIRHNIHELDRLIHPSVVPRSVSTMGNVAKGGAAMAWIFFLTFSLAIAAVMAALTLAGEDFDTALVLSLAALTNAGALAHQVAGMPIEYAALNEPTRVILGAAMIVGRMETLAILALLAPGSWRS